MIDVATRERIARIKQQTRPAMARAVHAAPMAAVPRAVAAASGPGTDTTVVPGGWFGGWLGVAPYWQNRQPGGGRMGVTDGSFAAPGEIGEFVNLAAMGHPALTANNLQTQTVTLGALGAGDWDVWAWFASGYLVNQVNFWIDPIPAGLSGIVQGVFESAGLTLAYVCSATVQLLSAQPSLIQFAIITNVPADSTYDLIFSARRMR